MKESELYIRLGVQGKCELEKILGFETKYNEQNTYFEILRKKPIVDRLIGAKFQGWRTMLDGGITNSKSQKLNLTMKLPKENLLLKNTKRCLIHLKKKSILIP